MIILLELNIFVVGLNVLARLAKGGALLGVLLGIDNNALVVVLNC